MAFSKSVAITTVWLFLLGTVTFFLLLGSIYTVQPTDVAHVRRFGSVITKREAPLSPGLHFKFPMIDQVDALPISLQTLHVNPFQVNTIDNQQITLEINFNYTIPIATVYHLLYEVGRSGSADIDDSIVPIAKDRAARVAARQNTTTISANREQIQLEIQKEVFSAVREMFQIEPHSLQIASIAYSPNFLASNEAAVRAKNEAIQAENTVRTRQAEATQKVTQAKGEADAAIESARGRAESVKLEAEAAKMRVVLEGEGQAAKTHAEIAPFGTVDKYIEYLRAKAALQWNGQTPQIVAGGSGASIPIVFPFPAVSAGGTKQEGKPEGERAQGER